VEPQHQRHDASGAATANGTHLILWACGTGTNQQWTQD
jgi:hypothetical protein